MNDRRRWAENLLSALLGIALFVLVVGWTANMNDEIVIRDCEAMGMVMLKGKPYRCERMEVPRD